MTDNLVYRLPEHAHIAVGEHLYTQPAPLRVWSVWAWEAIRGSELGKFNAAEINTVHRVLGAHFHGLFTEVPAFDVERADYGVLDRGPVGKQPLERQYVLRDGVTWDQVVAIAAVVLA